MPLIFICILFIRYSVFCSPMYNVFGRFYFHFFVFSSVFQVCYDCYCYCYVGGRSYIMG